MGNTGPKVEILFLSKIEVESLLTPKDAIDASEQAFKAVGEKQINQRHFQTQINENFTNTIAAMPVYIKSLKQAGIKWASLYLERQPNDNLPKIWGGMVILSNPENGQPYAIMDGVSITNMRTGGGHAVVAAKYLAKKNAKTLAIIGTGAQARTGFQSFSYQFSLDLVKVFDISPKLMNDFIEDMGKNFSGKIKPTNSVEEAVKGVDMVLVVTTSPKPVIMEPWLEEGCFLAGLTSFKDIDPMLSIKVDKWVLGSYEEDEEGILIGRTIKAPKELSKDNVYADMGEIVTGKKPGRETTQERILYTHLGMGAHDVILGNIAYERALKKEIGTKVYL